MPFLFTPERVRYMRQREDNLHAVLLGVTEKARVGSVRPLRREFVVHDADGDPVGRRRENVRDNVEGELVPVVLTVKVVERVDVYGGAGMTQQLARACGYKSPGALRTAWLALHPRSPLAQAVWFYLLDRRDRDLYLQRNVSDGGDYTFSRARASDDLPTLTPEQLTAMASGARQRDVRRRADVEAEIGTEPLAQRLARAEDAADAAGLNIYRERHLLTDRMDRLDKRREQAKPVP